MRLRFKRLAVAEARKTACQFKKREDRKAKSRAYYRKTHKRNPKEKRGRKCTRRQKYKPAVLPNGDTKVKLLTRCRSLLSQSEEKWGEHKRERAAIVFDLYPQIKEGYSLICKIRNIFKKKIGIEEAKMELHHWYKGVNACTLREIKSARDCLKSKESEVLNYSKDRYTNASAESLNSKIKGFRMQLHGVADIPFFMHRLCTIFG
jgi:transposase